MGVLGNGDDYLETSPELLLDLSPTIFGGVKIRNNAAVRRTFHLKL